MDAAKERHNAPYPRPSRDRPERPDYIQVKTYVVYRRVFTSSGDKPNIEVLDVKLNVKSAQAVVDAHAGTWFERVLADKRPHVTERN